MHFTYEPPSGHLKQGDLLKVTAELCKILKQFHPHYASNPDYRYLMVLTQECDLVRRSGRCKSKYITLAAVRSLTTLLYRELERHQRSSLEIKNHICSSEKRIHFEDFLTKLFNNNQQGYFYLAEEPELGISYPSVAFLALSIAIKVEHYDICVDARFAQLQNIFRAKLGWLIGDIYSRVGTLDWEDAVTKEKFSELINETINTTAFWLDTPILEALKEEQRIRRKKLSDNEYIIPEEELLKLIVAYKEKYEGKTRTERAAELVTKIASETVTGLSQEQAQKLKYRLINNDEFEQLIVPS